jgi:hypothetical protein
MLLELQTIPEATEHLISRCHSERREFFIFVQHEASQYYGRAENLLDVLFRKIGDVCRNSNLDFNSVLAQRIDVSRKHP